MPKCTDVKYCSVCHKPKKLKEFFKAPNNKTGYEGKCKECRHVSARPKQLMARYGITHEQYEDMLEKQGGVCAICETFELRKDSRYLVVDHCHTTNEIRGVLCHKCNTALGLFNDKEELLLKAIEYLKEKTHVITRT